MKKYNIYASEIVQYVKTIEAESLEQAQEMAQDLEWDYGDAVDGQQFLLEDIREA